MKKSPRLTPKRRYLLFSFLLPFLGYTIVMLVSQYAPFGRYSILYSDMYHQYFPFFVEFRETLRSGDSLLYNWNLGMGLDYLGLIAYYLASPLNLLSVFLPGSMLLGYFSMLVPIKLGLAGLFFGLLLGKLFDRYDWSLSMFSSAYGICAWALGYQWNIMWLDTFALTPLVILGLISLLRERKFLLYTISLFFSIVCNYYIGFFVCIFVGLCFLVYEISYAQSFRRFAADLGLVFLFSFLGIAMTAFLEWPAFQALKDTYSSVNKFPTTFALNIADSNTFLGLLDAMRQVAGNTAGGLEITFKEGLPNLYCGILPLMFCIQFFFNGKFKLRERLCNLFILLFFMLSFILRQLDYIWHGFHFTNMIPYRFSFLFSFVVLITGYRAFLELEHTPKWRMILSSVVFLGLAVCSDSRMEIPFIAYNLVFLGIFTYLLLARQRPKMVTEETEDGPIASLVPLSKSQKGKNRYLSLLTLAAMGLEMICGLVNFGVRFGGTSISNYPKGTEDAKMVFAHMKELESDSVYYRAETTKTQTLNDDALNGYSGITLFSSSANVRVTKFMAALGYGAKPSYNRYAYEQASPVSDLFLNLKYLISRDGKYLDCENLTHIYNMGQVDLMRNDAWLPLGFMVGDEAQGISCESGDSGGFQFLNRLFSAATGDRREVYEQLRSFSAQADEGITLTEHNIPGSYSYTTDSETGNVTVSFTVPHDGLVCLDFSVNKRNHVTVYKNDTELCPSESLNLDQMLSIGNCTAGDVIEVQFQCSKKNESGKITLNAGLLNAQVFWDGYNVLNSRTMDLKSLKGTTARGTVTVTEDAPILYTSIPYNKNWQATVDGVSVEPLPIFGAMVGLSLTPGTHEIVLTYHNAAFYQGLTVSLTALAILVLIVPVPKLSRRKGKFQGKR